MWIFAAVFALLLGLAANLSWGQTSSPGFPTVPSNCLLNGRSGLYVPCYELDTNAIYVCERPEQGGEPGACDLPGEWDQASGGAGGGGFLNVDPNNVTVSNSTTETSLYSFTLPANTLVADTCVTHIVYGFLQGTSTNTMTFRAKFGASVLTLPVVPTAPGQTPLKATLELCADGGANAQEARFTIAGGTDAYTGTVSLLKFARGEWTVNGTVDQLLDLTVQHDTASVLFAAHRTLGQVAMSGAGSLVVSSGVTPGVKGDINVVGADTNWVIVDGAVTNAKLADMATATIKGRTTAGTGDPEDLTAAQVATLLDPSIATQTELAGLSSVYQPLDADLTTLAGKTIAGTGANVRLSTGTFTTDACVKVDANGNFSSAGAVCGTGSGSGVTSFETRSGAVVSAAGDYTATEITTTPAGSLSAVTQAATNAELDAEKQTQDPELDTLAGKTIAGTGTDLRLSTGSFDTNDCVKVDASGNFTTAGAACGSGTGSGGGESLQETADIGRDITNATTLGTAVNIGDTTAKVSIWASDATGGHITFTPAGDMSWDVPDGFNWLIKDSTGTPFVVFAEATATATFANPIIAPNVPQLTQSASAPTIDDDESLGRHVHDRWIETTSDPDKEYVLVDATDGAAVWQEVGSTSGIITETQDINDVFNLGKEILGANSEANAFCVGNGTGKECSWYDGATGFQKKVTPAGNYNIDIPDTFAGILKYNGAEFVRWDSTGKQKFSGIGKPIFVIRWTAGSVETDGTNCATQAQSTVNSGSKIQDFGCVAFTTGAGRFYGHEPMSPSWSHTDTLTFKLMLRAIGSTSKTWKADVAMWCVSDGEAWPTDTQFNGVTPQEISITTGTTAHAQRSATTAAITPGSSCASGDTLHYRVQTKSGHDATAAEAKVTGGLINAKYLQLGD